MADKQDCPSELNDSVKIEDVPAEEESAFPGSGEETVTMLDVLEEQEELEENADAVLGGSDEKDCTYLKGYVNRQALYACRTCIEKSDSAKKGGICLACSFQCHEGHDLYELYTKRNFRCDCGVPSKFPETKCVLYSSKKSLNEDNKYNHNFEGRYCSCDRPYPDPDNDDEDEMIQCIICEDWHHGNHLGGTVPADDDYAEMICSTCMDSIPFLWKYNEREVQAPKRLKVEPTSDSAEPVIDSGIESSCDSVSGADKCILATNKKSTLGMKGPTFWDHGWRKNLCCCPECKRLYDGLGCAFLIDETDTCHHYEEQGKLKNIASSTLDRGMSAMGSTMPRTQQIEMIHGYNDLQAALKEYLKGFAESGKVVTQQDIKNFFDEFKSKARPRVDLSSCR
ncbi:putative E3 ubiquitin-protein ligase UBR7 [Halotydeus destructor]|nr:putative E3 ubiquitin-protein ligase UBR7 [Halotydeus destructor]